MLPRFLSIVALAILVLFPLSADSEEKAGADWWSLQPIGKPKFPAVKQAEWIRNPIDAFILAKLEEKGLSPARPADREAAQRLTPSGRRAGWSPWTLPGV